MHEFTNHGLRLEYEVTGTGVPFVFLHGMGGSVKQIFSVYEPLEGVQLINLNQQGHGNSDADWDHYDFDRLGDDVVALLDHLNIQSAYFAGISMGAAVSLNVAVRYPERVRKLLLIRNAWTDKPMSFEVQTAYHDLGACLHKGGLTAFYETEGWKIVSEPSPYTRNAFISPFDEESSQKYWKKFLILPGKTPIASLTDLDKLSMPVQILANKNDLCHPFAYGEYMHQHIKNSSFREIPDKDADAKGHKDGVNQAIQEMIFGTVN